MIDEGIFDACQYSALLLNYAGTCRLMGEVDQSISLFLNAKEVLEEANLTSRYEYASVLNNLAHAYQEKGNLEEALKMAKLSLEMVRSMEEAGQEIATAFSNIASIYFQMQNLEEASRYIEEAMKRYENMPEEDRHYAAALSTWASILYVKKDLAGAAKAYAKALELTERFFGKNLEYAILCHNLSLVSKEENHIEKAIEYQKEAVALCEGILDENSPKRKEYRQYLDSLLYSGT